MVALNKDGSLTQEKITVAGLESHEIFAVCMACMAHPHDPIKRQLMSAWFELRRYLAGDKSVAITEELLRHLDKAARVGVGNDLTDARLGGMMAGHVLRAVLAMQAAGIEDAGLDKAFHLVSDIHVGKYFPDGRPVRMKREMVKKHWEKYGAVAHFWGAYISLLPDAREDGSTGDLRNWQKGDALASVARAIQEKASTCVLPRSRELLLRKNAILLEGIAPSQWIPPEILPTHIQSLNKFNPRTR